jgi:hypothetical protein
VRLVLGKEIGPFGSGIEHLYRCLRRLALVLPYEPAAEDDVAVAYIDIVCDVDFRLVVPS